MRIRGPFAAALGLLCLSGAAEAAKSGFVPVLQADLRGAVAAVRHGKTAGGAVGSVFVLPAYRFSWGGTALPIYIFDGSLFDKVVEEEVFYQSRQVHAGSLGYRQKFGGGWSAKLSGDAAYALTTESRNEKLGKGLYDYRDFGARGVLSLDLGGEARPAPVSLSLRGFERRYPNYKSLASRGDSFLEATNPAAGVAIAGREQRPKDFRSAETGLEAVGWLGEKSRLQAEYGLGLRWYKDRYARTDQGLISDIRRFDQLHRLTLGAAFGMGAFVAGLDAGGVMNLSNGSIHDPAQPVHAYVPHYFQFWSASITPSILWSLPVGRELHPRVRLAVGGTLRGYPYRYTQDAAGAYKDGKQADKELAFDLRGWYPFAKWISATLGGSMRVARSNNEFEKFVKYNYELLQASAGVTITY